MEPSQQPKPSLLLPILLGLAMGLTVVLLGLLGEHTRLKPPKEESTPPTQPSVASPIEGVPSLPSASTLQPLAHAVSQAYIEVAEFDDVTLGQIHLLATVGHTLGDDPINVATGRALAMLDPKENLESGIVLLQRARVPSQELVRGLTDLAKRAEQQGMSGLVTLIDERIALILSGTCTPTDSEYY